MKKLVCILLLCLCLCSCLCLVAGAEEVVTTTEETGETTWGEDLLATVEEHLAEVFSALTLVDSLILSYSYKKGLVPTLWGGLSSIAKTAETTSEKTRELAEAAEVTIASLTDTAAPIFEKIEKMCQGADRLALQARELEARVTEAENDRALMKTMMNGVADMLYGVFSSANLPQYAKEQIGQRYNAIRAALGEESHGEECEEPTL